MNWKWVGSVTVGLFGAGVAVGYVAQKRGIPQDQVGRWLVKGVVRRALRASDALREIVPDQKPVALTEALSQEPPRPPSREST
ncbi:MAG: hypothetical protein V4850_23495 [Myxococcota bacterium]